MRHATTEWNEAGRIQGWLDSPLSAAGRTQAAEWAETLAGHDFSRIVSSDLGRAMETAQIISTQVGLPVEGESLFRERDFGSLAGAYAAAHPLVYSLERPGGGETLGAVRKRAMKGLYALGSKEGKRVLVVTHAGVLSSIFSFLADLDHPLCDGRLLKSRRLHWVGVSGVAGIAGIVELNGRLQP